MDAINVLHVLDKLSPDSGVSKVVMNYYAHLDYSQVNFDFMVNQEVPNDIRSYVEGNGSKIFVMPELRYVNFAKYIKALKAFYGMHEYKIIHGHVPNSAVFYFKLAKNVRFKILHSHSTSFGDFAAKKLRNFVLFNLGKHAANRYTACGNAAADFLFANRAEVTVFQNAVDIENYKFDPTKREEIRASLNISQAWVIGHIGRFCPPKNHKFLIDVFSEIYKNAPNAVLMLVGDGSLASSIREHAARQGVSKTVLFCGVRENTNDYLSAMDCFVLPSLYEGFPLTSIEAQVSGLPLILSDRITKQVNITGEATFLPLEKSLWVDALLEKKSLSRAGAGMSLKDGPFDIKRQTKLLCEYYKNLSGDINEE